MLKGKTALVTGSTSGIGQGIAEALAAGGANVVLNGFGEGAAIEALRAEIAEKNGVTVTYDGADMTKPAEIARMVKDAEAQFGAVDILVNNAGIQYVSPIEEFPDERWDAVIAINLSSAFHTTKAALPAMRSKGWGRIINIASAHGLSASANKSAYVAAKHGIVGLTKVTALETGGSGITCNAICPGWVLTPLVKKQIEDRAAASGKSYEEEKLALVAEKTPSKDFSTPEQIGGLAVFLCSPSADQITGAPLSIDGGWMAQ
ncbi:3-hydroxybutyrate dehydrogenase [Pelagibius marinus]|uniref:3-hydroxybutyrate dehydrogenase n=1 Tax=Pelagibius marinus TaxID=2762760 RepID=UPI001872F82B|nr:3-hydroxybutyrate dehydrogenase [Pelagibius marinus]